MMLVNLDLCRYENLFNYYIFQICLEINLKFMIIQIDNKFLEKCIFMCI